MNPSTSSRRVARSIEGRGADLFPEILDQAAEKLKAGQPLELEDLLREHPEFAERLRQVWPTLQMLAALGNSQLGRSSSSPISLELDRPAPSTEETRGAAEPTLGDFRIVREIGRGGMGVVYEAEQLSLGRRVALKVLPYAAMLDERQLQRFKNEARAAAGLHHPHIVPVHAVGCERGVHYYAMQYIEGQTLAEQIRRLRATAGLDADGPAPSASQTIGETSLSSDAGTNSPSADAVASASALPSPAPISATSAGGTRPTAALSTSAQSTDRWPLGRDWFQNVARMGVQIAEALEYAHSLGVVHRDIKPSNLILDGRGDVWITDFGLAQFDSDQALTVTGDILGTLRYMSPEQARGEHRNIDHRADIYSLGITLYELVSLSPAFGASNREILLRHVLDSDPKLPTVLVPVIPRDLETIICKAIAKEPHARFATAQELADDLLRFLAHQPIRARRPSPLLRLGKWRRRNPVLAAAILLFLALATIGGLVGAVFLDRQQQEMAHARKLAAEQRRTAEARRQLLRRNQYVVDVQVASQAFRRGDFAQAVAALEKCRPAEGDEDLRGFEWRYLWRVCRAAPAWNRQAAAVLHCAYSPDGSLLATAGKDGARVWNVATGELVHQVDTHYGDVNGIEFSHNGKWLATAGDLTVRLWSTADWKLEKTLFHLMPPMGVAFSADDSVLAVGLGDFASMDIDFQWQAQNSLMLWDTASWKLIARQAAHKETLMTIAYCQPGGGVFLTTGRDQVTRIFNADTGQPIASLHAESDGRSIAASRNRYLAAVGHEDGVVQFWDLGHKLPIGQIYAHRAIIPSLAFSHDNRVLATISHDRTLRLWDIRYFSRPINFATYRDQRGLGGVAFSPDDKTVATTNDVGEIKLWRVDKRQGVVRNVGRRIWFQPRIASSRNSRCVVIADSSLRTIDARTGATSQTIVPWESRTANVVFSPDKELLASVTTGGKVTVRRTADWQEVLSFDSHHQGVARLSFSPDGASLSVTCPEGALLWDLAANRKAPAPENDPEIIHVEYLPHGGKIVQYRVTWRRELEPPNSRQRSEFPGEIAFSRDRKQVAYFREGGVLQIANAQTWEDQMAIPDDHSTFDKLAFSPDGRTLAVGGKDGSVRLWNVELGREYLTLEGHPYSPVFSLAFADDGSWLASAGETSEKEPEVLIWSIYDEQASESASLNVGSSSGLARSRQNDSTTEWDQGE